MSSICGLRMAQTIPEEDKKRLALLPMMTKWIQNNRRLSDNELMMFLRQYMGHVDLSSPNITIKRMYHAVLQYRDHKLYGKDIQILLSPDGRKWIEDCLRRARKLAEKHR